ncbi:MAG: hypothetical protein ACOY8P_12610 [Thermodesulfobacteriota bacterium]
MSEEYTDKLYKEYTAQREKLNAASLEAAGRYDRAFLTISTGTLAISVAFIDRIVTNPELWTLYILVPGWISLLVSISMQLLALASSQNATGEQIRILDQQYSKYFSSEDPTLAVQEEYEEPENRYVKRTARLNIWSQILLIFGVVLILAFSSINIYLKKELPCPPKDQVKSLPQSQPQPQLQNLPPKVSQQ